MPDARRRDIRRWRERRALRRRRGRRAGAFAVLAVASAIVLTTAPGASAPGVPGALALGTGELVDRVQDVVSRSAERTAAPDVAPTPVPATSSAAPEDVAGAQATPDPPADPVPDPAAATEPAPAAAQPAPQPAAQPAPQPAVAAAPADAGAAMAAEVVTLTNERRTAAGLAPLGVSGCATEQAVSRAGVLAAEGRFEHDPLGPVLEACRAGTVGENLSLGYPSAQAAVAGWMDSPGHRENVLREAFTQIGVGCVQGPRGWLCAQVFVG